MRRLLFIVSLVVLPLLVGAQEDFFYKKVGEGQTLCLRKNADQELTVSVCRNVAKEGCVRGRLKVPEQVVYDGERYAVVAIADSAFYGCSELTAVELPWTLHSVGDHAFDDCPMLKRLVVGCDSLAYAHGAFGGTTKFDTLEIGKGVR